MAKKPVLDAYQPVAQAYAAYMGYLKGIAVGHKKYRGSEHRCDACKQNLPAGSPQRKLEVTLRNSLTTAFPQARSFLIVCDDPEACAFRTSVRIRS